MSIKGRINFRQMSRYGCFSNTTYRNNFEKSFDFGKFNSEHIKQKDTAHYVILFDPSHIRKMENTLLVKVASGQAVIVQ